MIAQRTAQFNTGTQQAQGLALGNIVKSASTSDIRKRRYELQEAIADILKDSKIARCMHSRISSRVSVMFADGHSYYQGLATCGNIWLCPVCSAKISARRRSELSEASDHFSGSIFMVSFTLSHNKGDRLADIKDTLNRAYKRTFSGRRYQALKERYKIAGTVTAQEVTFGDSGWHAHKHTLFFSELTLSKSDLFELMTELSSGYRMALDKFGGFGSESHALEVTDGGPSAVRKYLAKFGLAYEVTMTETKTRGGLKPFEIAELAAQGDKKMAALFREYADAYKGSRQLVYSKGLKERLGIKEKDDQEVAAEPECLVMLDGHSWREVCKRGLRAQLLDEADCGSPEVVMVWLKDRSLSYEWPPPAA